MFRTSWLTDLDLPSLKCGCHHVSFADYMPNFKRSTRITCPALKRVIRVNFSEKIVWCSGCVFPSNEWSKWALDRQLVTSANESCRKCTLSFARCRMRWWPIRFGPGSVFWHTDWEVSLCHNLAIMLHIRWPSFPIFRGQSPKSKLSKIRINWQRYTHNIDSHVTGRLIQCIYQLYSVAHSFSDWSC